MARPLASAGMVVKTLGVSQQAARRIVGELGLREMTGRGVSGVGRDLSGRHRGADNAVPTVNSELSSCRQNMLSYQRT